jgi:hypothetical protein
VPSDRAHGCEIRIHESSESGFTWQARWPAKALAGAVWLDYILGIACGTTNPSVKKDTPIGIGLSGAGHRAGAKIVNHRAGAGHFLSARSATGTIRYTRGSRLHPPGYCDSGSVHRSATPGSHNF